MDLNSNSVVWLRIELAHGIEMKRQFQFLFGWTKFGIVYLYEYETFALLYMYQNENEFLVHQIKGPTRIPVWTDKI